MITLNGSLYSRMINSGAANLKKHVEEVNDLNVFPIPDGDTGDNMLLTMVGGVLKENNASETLYQVAKRVSNGMLLSARGNSGVILSQFFGGVEKGLEGLNTADVETFGRAFACGVTQAYSSVMTPTEGTILTVLREATDYAGVQKAKTLDKYLEAFIEEANKSLQRTPELLPVLKKAGVVDSGAAGLIYIVDGMRKALTGEEIDDITFSSNEEQKVDYNAFDEKSVLEYGYCTELLLRLQVAKTDILNFNADIITNYLKSIGDSVAVVYESTIVKIHVHTMKPQKVLDYCQKYGEFLKVKIENMSLQHNNAVFENQKQVAAKERKKYAVVAVVSGEGIKQAFVARGADVIVDGGQSMNPSAQNFISAFDEANSDVIFVYPNNGNVILTAQQAAKIYNKSDVRVIESSTIGAGYASISMLDTSIDDVDEIEKELQTAMVGVVTAEIPQCVRNASIGDCELQKGDYIGFVGKDIMAFDTNRFNCVCKTIEKMGLAKYDICIVFSGKNVNNDEMQSLEDYIINQYKGKEIYIVNGGQDVYDYIIAIE